jgi:hypothetical protein
VQHPRCCVTRSVRAFGPFQATSGLSFAGLGVVEPPSREAILRLRAWLATAALPSWWGRRAALRRWSSILPEVFLDRATTVALAAACLNHRMGPIPIVGIGQLVDKGRYWQLVYEACGHTLATARFADRDPVEQVRRWHATCLECESQRRSARRSGHPL